MASSSIINSLEISIKQINIYMGLPILILGIVGGLFNIAIFRTLKTFRETTCAFYLTMASIFNIGQLTTGVLISILAFGFNIDPTGVSSVCKIRMFLAQWFGLLSLNSMCLATIDQFLTIKYQYTISLKSAGYLIFISCLVWSFHGVFFILYWDSLNGICTTINIIFGIYITYFHFPVLVGILPLSIMIIFSCLAFSNVRSLTNRQINAICLSRDRQLTLMTLIQITFIVIASIPFITKYMCSLNRQSTDTQQILRDQLIDTIINYIYYTSYANSFYFYCLISKRFRKQFLYVLIDIHLRRWRQQVKQLNNNQVLPNSIQINNQENKIKTEEIALY